MQSLQNKRLSRDETIYKCIVLDLDNTLWFGTLVEDGIQGILENLKDESKSAPFTSFQENLVRIAKKGIFIALCTHNSEETVKNMVDNYLTPDSFPLKEYIDVIVANTNHKSDNLRQIAQEFNILLSAIIFVDDSLLNREEVLQNAREVNVFDFPSEVKELARSFSNMNYLFNEQTGFDRRERYRLIKVAKSEQQLPLLSATLTRMDAQCSNATRDRVLVALMERTNQFNWTKTSSFDELTELFFVSLFHVKSDLGIVSAFAITVRERVLLVNNWAVSCGFFDIGLEDYILSKIINMASQRNCTMIEFSYTYRENNTRCVEFIEKYNLSVNEANTKAILNIATSTLLIARAINSNHAIEEKK